MLYFLHFAVLGRKPLFEFELLDKVNFLFDLREKQL